MQTEIGLWDDLLALNAERIGGDEHYCAVTRSDAGIVVGPTVLPRQTPCLRCVQRMIDLGAIDGRFVPTAPATQQDAIAARDAIAAEHRLIGRMILIDAEWRVAGSIAVARFSNCADCRPAPQPAEVHYATQLFRKEIG
jgi:hypothetical protein